MFKRKPDAIRPDDTVVQYFQEENGKSGYTLYKPYTLLPWYELYVWVREYVDEGRQARLVTLWGKPGRDQLTDVFDDVRAVIIKEWFNF